MSPKSPRGPFLVEFIGQFTDLNVPAITANGSGCSPASATLTAETRYRRETAGPTRSPNPAHPRRRSRAAHRCQRQPHQSHAFQHVPLPAGGVAIRRRRPRSIRRRTRIHADPPTCRRCRRDLHRKRLADVGDAERKNQPQAISDGLSLRIWLPTPATGRNTEQQLDRRRRNRSLRQLRNRGTRAGQDLTTTVRWRRTSTGRPRARTRPSRPLIVPRGRPPPRRTSRPPGRR